MDNFNLFDLITLSIIVFLGLKGIFSGFVKEVFALFGIVGGVFVASRIATDFSSSSLLVFVVAFAGFWALCYFAGIAVAKVAGLSGLGILDKILGFVFAGGKIFFIISVIVYAASNIEVLKSKIEPKMANSTMYPIYVYGGSAIMKLDTNNILNKVDANATKAVDTAKQAVDVSAKIKEISK